MTDWRKKKKQPVEMRSAAVIALLIVISLCVLFLLVTIPLRALRDSGQPSAVSVTLVPVPAETPSPSPLPTSEPVVPSILTFDESAENPLPNDGDRLAYGQGYSLRGTVQSNYPLLSVALEITCAYSEDPRYPYTQTVTFAPENAVYSYPLDDALTLEGASIDSLAQFSALDVGVHTLRIYASSTGQFEPQLLFKTEFYILSDEWLQIKSSDFSNNSYTTALAFFQEKDAFLYRYQWVDARYIVADPDWENKYIVSFDCLPGRKLWRIHAYALPYYQAVSYYLNNVRVRVSGTSGDSGVLLLRDLIDTDNGSYCSRFTSSENYISHHAFGTATDLNGGMGANDNQKENIALINDEVKDNLSYNGIKNENNMPYYDFTYSGDSLIWVYKNVPETVINYLLYDLAFYRAGFQWGHYYVSSSDAMHFTLTDNIRVDHSGNAGLRKVYEYAETYAPPELWSIDN